MFNLLHAQRLYACCPGRKETESGASIPGTSLNPCWKYPHHGFRSPARKGTESGASIPGTSLNVCCKYPHHGFRGPAGKGTESGASIPGTSLNVCCKYPHHGFRGPAGKEAESGASIPGISLNICCKYPRHGFRTLRPWASSWTTSRRFEDDVKRRLKEGYGDSPVSCPVRKPRVSFVTMKKLHAWQVVNNCSRNYWRSHTDFGGGNAPHSPH